MTGSISATIQGPPSHPVEADASTWRRRIHGAPPAAPSCNRTGSSRARPWPAPWVGPRVWRARPSVAASEVRGGDGARGGGRQAQGDPVPLRPRARLGRAVRHGDSRPRPRPSPRWSCPAGSRRVLARRALATGGFLCGASMRSRGARPVRGPCDQGCFRAGVALPVLGQAWRGLDPALVALRGGGTAGSAAAVPDHRRLVSIMAAGSAGPAAQALTRAAWSVGGGAVWGNGAGGRGVGAVEKWRKRGSIGGNRVAHIRRPSLNSRPTRLACFPSKSPTYVGPRQHTTLFFPDLPRFAVIRVTRNTFSYPRPLPCPPSPAFPHPLPMGRTALMLPATAARGPGPPRPCRSQRLICSRCPPLATAARGSPRPCWSLSWRRSCQPPHSPSGASFTTPFSSRQPQRGCCPTWASWTRR